MRSLPVGWRLAPLGEVADTALGKMLDRGKDRGHREVPYLRNVNVQWGRITTDDVLSMQIGDDELNRFAVEAGDLLVCEGGEVGRCAIWHGSNDYMAYQKALHRIRPHDDLDAKYLRYLLEAYATDGTLKRHSTGSTIAHLPQQRLQQLPVPLPEREEQRRIIDILEDHLSRLDAAGTDLQNVVRRVGAGVASSLTQMWNAAAALVEPSPINSFARIVTGSTPSNRIPDAFGDGLPFVTPGDVAYGDEIRSTQRELSSLGAAGSRIVGPNAVLVVCIGATLGKVGFVDREVATNQQINSMLFIDPAASAAFAARMISSPPFQRLMQEHATTTTIPLLNKSAFSQLKLPLPTPQDQADLSTRHVELNANMRRLADAAIATGLQAAALRRSLLSAAFSGRLSGRPEDMDLAEELAAASAAP